MYAQATAIRVPVGAMAQMRRVIEQEYLPQICQREGFISAQFMEQVDDPEAALLVVLWENQHAVEAFHRTGALLASVNALSSQLPGVRVRRDAFLVTARAEPVTRPAQV